MSRDTYYSTGMSETQVNFIDKCNLKLHLREVVCCKIKLLYIDLITVSCNSTLAINCYT